MQVLKRVMAVGVKHWRRLLLGSAPLLAIVLAAAVLEGPYARGGPVLARAPEFTPQPDKLHECGSDPAQLPPPPSRADGRPARYYHTCGSRIVSADGQVVQFTGVNWFGTETGTYAPHGLWTRSWRAILDQIGGLGFNVIRLPFSNDALRSGQMPRSINYELNPDLAGKTALEVLDAIVAGAAERGLKVILDRHRPTAEAQSELWYTEAVSEEQWLADWVMLARRYRAQDAVIGVDLHNEPRGPATWGSDDPGTDWRAAAERAGNAVLDVNPYLLIFVQGVERYGDDWYWWGGNLQGVQKHPVRLKVSGRVVYSPHVYGPGVYPQSWFSAPDFPDNLPGIWASHWGYITQTQSAPVVLGEFGGRSVGDDPEGQWQRALVDYLSRSGVGWISWSFNPNSSDTGGVLGADWKTVVEEKATLYRAYAAAPLDVGSSGVFGLPKDRLLVRARNSNTDQQTSSLGFIVQIMNDGPKPINLHDLELRYWFDPGRLGNRTQEVTVDYAAMGQKNVRPQIKSAGRGGLWYVGLSFSEDAGAVAPYTPSGEIIVRVHKSDWSPYRQTSDFSFKADGKLGDWDRITLYRDGQRVWGREPDDEAKAER